WPEHRLERLARDPVVHVRRCRDVRRLAGAARQRTRSGRSALRTLLDAPEGLRRPARPDLLPDAGDGGDAVLLVAALPRSLVQRRDVAKRRRADPLAGGADDAARLRAADAAGR